MLIAPGSTFPAELYDVCVIGSGPAGLAIAFECERRGLDVAVLEAGTNKPSTDGDSFAATILNEAWHVPLPIGARQSFGGTSVSWGGLCVAMDSLDLARRAHVADSGWPIDFQELLDWEEPAATFLGCGEPRFRHDEPSWQPPVRINSSSVGRLARHWNLVGTYRKQLERSRRIHVRLGARVIALTPDAEGQRIVGVKIARRAGETLDGPRARMYVIAGGGLQSTALLLELQRQHPRALDGENGPLGRFYMGHVTGEIATIVFNNPADAADLLYQFDKDGIPKQRRLQFSDELQRAERLLNTAFTLRSPPLADSAHGSGALSLAYMASQIPKVTGFVKSRRFLNTASHARRSVISAHFANVLKRPHTTLVDACRLLLRTRIEKLPLVLLNRSGRYGLRYHAEQAPNPNSRVWLNQAAIANGGPELAIDFRYQDEDAQSVLRAHATLDRLLRASGRGYIEYWHPPEERLAAVFDEASDGYHQIGTTRMGADPRSSVVDPDCRVHGLSNLFVSSSSVFPTSAAANPTFTIVCLAQRLAFHLSQALAARAKAACVS